MSKTFSIDLADWVDKVATPKADAVVRAALFDIFNRVNKRSPVGQPELWADNITRASKGKPPLPKGYLGGHFRANWQLGVSSPPTSEIDGVDPSGQRAVSNAMAKVPAKAMGGDYFYVNNAPYAEALENGHSRKQAPLGVVGVTVLEWNQIVRKAAASLGSK